MKEISKETTVRNLKFVLGRRVSVVFLERGRTIEGYQRFIGRALKKLDDFDPELQVREVLSPEALEAFCKEFEQFGGKFH